MPGPAARRDCLVVLLIVSFAAPAVADCFDFAAAGFRELGTVPGGPAFDLVAQGGVLYAACGGQGIAVWDVSRPLAPVLLSRIDGLPGRVNRIACDGIDLVGVVEGFGLMMWDVTTPATPNLAGVHATPYVAATAVAGGRVYVSNGFEAVLLERGATVVMDTASAVIGGAAAGPVLLLEDMLIVPLSDDLLEIIGLSGTGELSSIGFCGLTFPATALALDGDWLFASVGGDGAGGGLDVVDFRDPANSLLQPIVRHWFLPRTRDLALAPGLVAVLQEDGLQTHRYAVVYDRTDPSRPQRLAEIPLPGRSPAIAAAVGVLFVAREDGDILVIDLTERTTAPWRTLPAVWSAQHHLDLDGDQVFTGSETSGYRIVDAATGDVLHEDPVTGVRALDACNDRLLVVYDGPTLAWLDVAVPTQPTLLALLPLPVDADPPEAVLLGDDRAVVRCGARGLVFYDLLPGGAPTITGAMTLPANAGAAMAWWGDDLLIRLESPMTGLALIGGTRRPWPHLDDWMSGAGFTIATAGERAYVTDATRLQVLRRDEAGRLTETGSVELGMDFPGVAVAQGTAYVAAYHWPVQAFALGDPDAPAFLGTGPVVSGGFRLLVNDRWLVWQAWADVAASPPQCAPGPVAAVVPKPRGPSVSVVPNPTNPATEVRFDVPVAGPVTVVVHDAAGRRVRMLADARPCPAGPAVVTWDGRDDGGRPAAAGVYLVLVRTPAGDAAVKAALVR